MFDLGWSELFIIAAITLIVVGPKEIPRVLRTVTLWIRRIREMARDFQSGIDDIAREAELDDIKKQLAEAEDFDLEKTIEDTVDPHGELSNSIQDVAEPVDQAKSMTEEAAQAVEPDDVVADEAPKALPDPSRAAGS